MILYRKFVISSFLMIAIFSPVKVLLQVKKKNVYLISLDFLLFLIGVIVRTYNDGAT